MVWGREGRDTSAAMRLPKEIELKDAPWALNRVLYGKAHETRSPLKLALGHNISPINAPLNIQIPVPPCLVLSLMATLVHRDGYNDKS